MLKRHIKRESLHPTFLFSMWECDMVKQCVGVTQTEVLIHLLQITNSVALACVSLASKMGLIVLVFEDPGEAADNVLGFFLSTSSF